MRSPIAPLQPMLYVGLSGKWLADFLFQFREKQTDSLIEASDSLKFEFAHHNRTLDIVRKLVSPDLLFGI